MHLLSWHFGACHSKMQFLQFHDIHKHMAMFLQLKFKIHGLEINPWGHELWLLTPDFCWLTSGQGALSHGHWPMSNQPWALSPGLWPCSKSSMPWIITTQHGIYIFSIENIQNYTKYVNYINYTNYVIHELCAMWRSAPQGLFSSGEMMFLIL